MPIFRFLVHGRNPMYAPGVHGFYTTRHAYGSSREAAWQKLIARLRQEFSIGISAPIWKAPEPELEIEDVWQISIFQLLNAPNKGSTFYDQREPRRAS